MRIRNSLSAWFCVSVFLHLLVFLYTQIEARIYQAKIHKPIEIVVLLKRVQRTKNIPKKVVEQDEKPINDQIDPKTKLLSQNNQKVAKQTEAPLAGRFSNTAGKGLTKSVESKVKTKDENTVHTDTKGTQAFKIHEDARKITTTTPTEESNEGDGKDVSRNNSYLRNLEKAKQTLLSTKTFAYYAYLKKIRNRIEEYWEPAIKPKFQEILDSKRGPASIEERTTKLLIILDSAGELVGVQRLGASGIQDLDDTAMKAFQVATPFPPPPPGLVDKAGLVKIRWDFVLEQQ